MRSSDASDLLQKGRKMGVVSEMKTVVMTGIVAVAACAGHLVHGQCLEVASPESQGVSSWKFSDTNVEPLFANCGTRDIAATGRLLSDGSLSVTWQMLGGIRHGSFTVAVPGTCGGCL